MTLGTLFSRTAMVACMLLLLPALALGQQRGGGPPDLDVVMAELTEKLELTDEQAVEIRELLEIQTTESRTLIEEARASGQGRAGMAGMRERMVALREETDVAVEAILSEEQAVVYHELQVERAEERQRRRASGGM